jgi:hypothetical protein
VRQLTRREQTRRWHGIRKVARGSDRSRVDDDPEPLPRRRRPVTERGNTRHGGYGNTPTEPGSPRGFESGQWDRGGRVGGEWVREVVLSERGATWPPRSGSARGTGVRSGATAGSS